MNYKLTDNEILSTLLLNNKDRFIKSIDWETVEIPIHDSDGNLVDGGYKTRKLEDVLEFFHTHANLENKINWNEKDPTKLAIEIDALISETYKKADEKEERKKTAKGVDWESHGCKVWYDDSNYTLVSPLSWESAKFMDSDECGGAPSQWCIGWETDERYWKYYTKKRECFVMIYNKHPTNIYNDLKVMVEFITPTSYKIWEQVDTTIGYNEYGSKECFIEGRYGTKYSDFTSLIMSEAIPKALEIIHDVFDCFGEIKFDEYKLFFESLIRDGFDKSKIEYYSDLDNPIEDCLNDWLSETDMYTKILNAWVENGLFVRIGDYLYLARGTKMSDVIVDEKFNIPHAFTLFIKRQIVQSIEVIDDFIDLGREHAVTMKKAFAIRYHDDDVLTGNTTEVDFTYDEANDMVVNSRFNPFMLNIKRKVIWFNEYDNLYWDNYGLYDVVPKLMETLWKILNSHVDLNKYMEVAQRGYIEPKTIKLKGTFNGDENV